MTMVLFECFTVKIEKSIIPAEAGISQYKTKTCYKNEKVKKNTTNKSNRHPERIRRIQFLKNKLDPSRRWDEN